MYSQLLLRKFQVEFLLTLSAHGRLQARPRRPPHRRACWVEGAPWLEDRSWLSRVQVDVVCR